MKGKVNCTCGWSWNKSDSSAKDMYICHECGRDNSNNMKNGGWMDNYNDSKASAPEGMVGDGFSNVGRNYSPAWGGQFKEGGEIPMAQKGKKVKPLYVESKNDPRYKAYIDSLNLHTRGEEWFSNKFRGKNTDPDIKKKYGEFPLLPQEMIENALKNKPTGKKKIITGDGFITERVKESYINGKLVSSKIVDRKVKPGTTYWKNTYDKPQQQVIVKPTTTKETTEQNVLQKRELVESLTPLQPIGIQNDFNIEASLPVIRPEAQIPKSYDVSTVFNSMKGPTTGMRFDREPFNRKEATLEQAMQILEYADKYNANIQEKYGPESWYYTRNSPRLEALAADRANKIKLEVGVKPNYQTGGQFENGGLIPIAQQGKKVSNYNTKLKKTEKDLIKKYVTPAQKRAQDRAIAQGVRGGLHNGPLDAIRHSSSSAATSSILPSWANFLPAVAPLNILATNVAGALHEYNSPNDWKETSSDLYNNFIGSVVGTLPMSEKKKHDLLIQAQKNNVLSNVKNSEDWRTNPKFTPKRQMGGNVYPVNYVPQAAMGASMPGAVGFTYARTKGIPSNGPYAKKTMASAQNGVDMHGSPITAIEKHRYDIDRSYYDPRTNIMNLGYDYAASDDKDKMIAHENYHAKQHKEGRDNFDIAHNTDNEQWARMQKRPQMMTTPEVWNNFYNRKAIESDMMINKIAERLPESQFFRNAAGDIIYNKIVDPRQYKIPYSFEGEAEYYENTGEEFQNGGEMRYYQNGLDWKPKGMRDGGWLNKYEKAQEGIQTTTSGGKDIKVKQPDGTIKIVNTGSPEYEEMYKAGNIQSPGAGEGDNPLFGGEIPEVVVQQKMTPLLKAKRDYGYMSNKEAFINRKKDEYLKSLGRQNWFGASRSNFPETVLSRILREYDYKQNTRALEDVAKVKGFDLNTRGEWIYDLTPAERKALINSKYSAQLNPNEFAEMASGVQQLLNTVVPGQPWNIDIPGLTQRELKEDRESWMSPLKVFAPLNTPGNFIANSLRNIPNSDVVETPWFGMQRMGDVSELEAMALNPLNITMIEGAANLLTKLPTAVRAIPSVARSIGLGFKNAGNFLTREKGLLSEFIKPNVNSSIDNVAIEALAKENALPELTMIDQPIVPKSFQMEELPGLHIKSTQTGSPLEKQLSKTGDINVNNITAHINKADVSQQDKFILDKVLKEKFPDQTKINYNDFRKAVSDELVTLEKTFDDTYSAHGLEALGFNGTKKSSYEMAINNTKADIDTFTKKIAEYENKIKTNAEAVGGTSNENMLAGYKGRLKEAELQLAKNEAEYAKLPLENQTVVYSNKSGFGEGNAKHFPDKKEALGHARTLVTPEEPDIMHILESQSDYAQSAGNKIESLNPKIDKERLLNKQKQLQEDEKLLNEYKYNYENNIPDEHGYKINKSQVDQLEQNFLDKKNAIELKLQNFKNPEQKNFFVKSHQERLLQENMIHAVEQGKTKMRYPTSETAAKNQGYEKIPFKWKRGEPVVLPNNKTGKINNEVLWDDIINVIDENGKVIEVPANEFKQLNPKFYNEDFSPKHKTILKKYDEAPKMIKKTIGQDVRLVTDSNGNTWYEFDIPESFIQGKGEIRAFKQGGIIGSDRGQGNKITEFPIAQYGIQTFPARKIGDEKGEAVKKIDKTFTVKPGKLKKVSPFTTQVSKEVEFMKNWTNSPMYNQMLNNSTRGVEDEQDIKNIRKERLNDISIEFSDTPKFFNKNTRASAEDSPGHITFYPSSYSSDLYSFQGTPAHEISHIQDNKRNFFADFSNNVFGTNFNTSYIPQSDINMMNKYSKSGRVYDLLFNKLKDNDEYDESREYFKYVAIPTETRARLNSLRYIGKEHNIYDPYTQKINMDQLEKLRQRAGKLREKQGSNPYTQLQNAGYNDEEILNMLNTISQNKDRNQNPNIATAKDGRVIKDDRGQWDHPGKITRIKGGNITMKRDPKTGKALTEPLLGIADTGEQQWMYPGEDYNFEGANYVTEIPKRMLAKNGLRQEQKGLVNLDNLLNFTNYNKPQPGGWLDSYK